MKLRRGGIVSGLLLMCVALAQCTLGPGLSTPDQRAKVVALTQSLEREPLAGSATASRQWLQEWIVEVPDIKVYVCDALLGHGLGDNYPYSRELSLQAMFSAAVFAIEHEAMARDANAQYHAGVQGALRMYEALVQSKPDAKSAFLDDFLAKRDRGALADHVARLAHEKCKRPNVFLIAHLAGAGVAVLLGIVVAWLFGGRRATGSAGVTGDGGSSRPRLLRNVVFACAAYYVIVVAALHILEPQYDPRFWFMSGYALGAYGWLMTTTFFVLGLAIFVVAGVLRDVHQSSSGARIGFGLLAVAALFVCLAGVFKDSIPHLAAGVVAFPSMLMAVLLLSWSFRQAAAFRPIYRTTLSIALGMLAAFLLMVADVWMPGLQQRAFILLFLLWLAIVIHRSTQSSAAP